MFKESYIFVFLPFLDKMLDFSGTNLGTVRAFNTNCSSKIKSIGKTTKGSITLKEEIC